MVLSLSTWTLNLSLFKSRNRKRSKTLSLSVVAGYYGTDDGKPTQSLHTRKENSKMFAIIFTAIFFGIISILSIIAVIAIFTIYRLTGGRKSFLWYIRHI